MRVKANYKNNPALPLIIILCDKPKGSSKTTNDQNSVTFVKYNTVTCN